MAALDDIIVGGGSNGCRDNLPGMQKVAVYTGEALAELEEAFA